MKFQFLFIIILSSLSLSSHSAVIAKAGSDTITDVEFEKSYKEAVANSVSLLRPPTKKEHLEDLIRFKIGLQEAKKSKIEKDPRVKRALELETYKALVELNLGEKVNKIKVNERDMKKYYQKNPNMRSSHILVRFPVGASKKQILEAKNRALKIYKEVKSKKKKWADYTQLYSEDEVNKRIGGDLGFHSSKSIHPRYYEQLKKLKMDEVSAPIRGVYGYHIIKKTGQMSYKDANKNAINLAVFDEKRFQLFDKYFEKLKRKYKISRKKDFLN